MDATERKLRQELADLRAGVVFHVHRPIGKPEWRCSSPYCEDLTSDEPSGRPGGEPNVQRYRRE